jgi:hypothetical protein
VVEPFDMQPEPVSNTPAMLEAITNLLTNFICRTSLPASLGGEDSGISIGSAAP